MSVDEILLVQAAEALALWLHRDQVDKQGFPYIEHLGWVAARVDRLGGSPEQVAAAWLHDAVEDGHTSLDAIKHTFPERVAGLVDHLTRAKWAGETYGAYIDRLTGHPDACLIKLADLTDNMDRSRGPAPKRLTERYERALTKIRAALAQEGSED